MAAEVQNSLPDDKTGGIRFERNGSYVVLRYRDLGI